MEVARTDLNSLLDNDDGHDAVNANVDPVPRRTQFNPTAESNGRTMTMDSGPIFGKGKTVAKALSGSTLLFNLGLTIPLMNCLLFSVPVDSLARRRGFLGPGGSGSAAGGSVSLHSHELPLLHL